MSLHHPQRQPGDNPLIASSTSFTHSIPLSLYRLLNLLFGFRLEGEVRLLLPLPAQLSPVVAAPNEVKGTVVAAILTLFISDLTYCKLVSDMIQIYGSQMVDIDMWATVLLIISAIAVQN
ncbi:hypothetical protein Syun_011233 [Stephania yunnanensis]|uniref:Uncharacterized protein n=1 Tax=Stephania yunnanensis TaxID=152371 RepID=A0AAP0PE85_9MAGN